MEYRANTIQEKIADEIQEMYEYKGNIRVELEALGCNYKDWLIITIELFTNKSRIGIEI